ncbi:MAG TPA: hypothetical protein VMD08_17740 [Candidatus Baltobacteraceae bacterium]|nr:hypothetical protein [Candidatus Baltobacteraceae bacterium]
MPRSPNHQRVYASHRLTADGWRLWPRGLIAPVGPAFPTLLDALRWEHLESRVRSNSGSTPAVEPTFELTRDPTAPLHLPDVKTIIYTVPTNVMRQSRLAAIMARTGTRDWDFFYGPTRQPYAVWVAAGHEKLLRDNEPPLLILEDDANVDHYRASVSPPEGTKIALLGGAKYGPKKAAIMAYRRGLQPKRRWQMWYTPIDHAWFRPLSMWGSHAYLYLDRQAMLDLADRFAANLARPAGQQENIDTVQSLFMSECPMAAAARPWYYQNDGHNEWATLRYCPTTT